MPLWMISVLTAYVVLHSPVRALVARALGRPGFSSYFTPGEGLFSGPVLNAVLALLAICFAVLAAAAWSRSFRVEAWERPLVFGLLAFSLVVVPAAVLGAVGAWWGLPLLRPPLGLLLVSTSAALGSALGLRRGLPAGSFRVRNRRVPLGLAVLGGVAALLLLATATVSAGRPPTGYDALSFHAPMAVYFWRDGDIASLLERAPWGFALAHPGAAELWFGLLLVGFGEGLASLGQMPFAILGALSVHAFGRRLGLPSGGAAIGALAFLLAPMVVLQAGVQLTDLTSAALLMAGVALASAPPRAWTPSRAAAVGLALGLSVSAKLAALPAAVVIALALVLGAVRAGRAGALARRSVVTSTVAFGLAFAAPVAPWWGRNVALFGNPIYPAAVPLVGRGYVVGDFTRKDTRFVPSAAAWPAYPLLESHSEESGLGPIFLVAAVPGLAAAVLDRRRRLRRWPLGLYGLAAVASFGAWWTLTQHEPRHLLGVLGLTFAFAAVPLRFLPTGRRGTGIAVIITAAAFSALVTLDRGLAPRLSEPADRSQYFDQTWGIDPLVAERDDIPALLYNTGYATLSYAGDYALLGPDLQRTLLTVDAGVSADSIVSLMLRAGARFAYVPTSPESQLAVDEVYSPDRFELVHVSIVEEGPLAGTRRSLYELRDP